MTHLEFREYQTFFRARQLLIEADISHAVNVGSVIVINEKDEEAVATKLAEFAIHSEFTTPRGLIPDYFVNKP